MNNIGLVIGCTILVVLFAPVMVLMFVLFGIMGILTGDE